MLTSAISIKAQEAYAVISEDGTTLTFFYDNIKDSREGTIFFPLNSYDSWGNVKTPEWHYYCDKITSVIFDSSFADARPVTTSRWFYEMNKLNTILGIQYLDTQNVTDMGEMFYRCSSLTSLDVSHFNTQNVKSMGGMFSGCSSLYSLDVSNFDTSKVTEMGFMFDDCSSLTSLDVSHFDTRNVENMQYMFNDCSSLTSLDLSNFDTKNVKQGMSHMFSNCSSLISLNLSNFDTRNVLFMWRMFKNCSSLTSLDLSNFDTRNVLSMYEMFYGCSSLTSLDLSNFDTQNLSSEGIGGSPVMNFLKNCSLLSSLKISASLGNSFNNTSNPCSYVGTKDNPCTINQPDGFDFGVDTSGDYFEWKGGYFTLKEDMAEEIKVTSNLGYITYCTDKALDFTNVEGMKAYIVVGYDGKVAKLSRIGIVPPETGLLLKADAGEYEVPYTEEDNYVMNMLIGVLEETTLSPTEGNMTNLVLANGKNGLGFYCLKGSGTIAAHRAYLQVPTRLIGNDAKFIRMEFDDDVTAIGGITTQEEAAPYYDLQGVRHEGKPTKQGIYIMNGKKVVVKD